jgi:mevalonate kinase
MTSLLSNLMQEAYVQLNSSAPGSLMLFGEHAVLAQQSALVCAINKRIHVNLIPTDAGIITIESKTLGNYQCRLDELTICAPFQFVLAAIIAYQAYLPCGFHLEIEADFSDKIGFGSSAAVTVATLAALQRWCFDKLDHEQLLKQGLAVIKTVQGVGSGADIAAATYGGIIHYCPQPFICERISQSHPLTVIYAGYKTKTVEVIATVKQYFAPYPGLLSSIYQSIGQCTKAARAAIKDEDWQSVGQVMAIQQGLMQALQVVTPDLQMICDQLTRVPGILGAKISGSGLGDCIIGLGQMATGADSQLKGAINIKPIDVKMSASGVICEKI